MVERRSLFQRRPPCIVSRCFHTNGVGEGFNLHKRCMIHSLPESMPKRALLSFKKGSTPYPQTTRLMVRDRMVFTRKNTKSSQKNITYIFDYNFRRLMTSLLKLSIRRIFRLRTLILKEISSSYNSETNPPKRSV